MSGSDIISNISNIENEIALAKAPVTEKEREISELTIQIQELKIKLNMFLGEYNSRVGSLYVKLDRLKLRIKEYNIELTLPKAGACLRKP